jgi:glutamate/tyrosine decarboxylase-like PLP-dependent enzyme
MNFIPFSEKYPNEFLNREEDNFDVLLSKINAFYNRAKSGIQDGTVSRRVLETRFNYEDELKKSIDCENPISSEEVADEFSDMFKGCIRHQDPSAAFNIIPTPLFDTIAGITIASLYNTNACWDFISGKLCLYEKKLVKILGHLVGWNNPNGLVVTGGKQALAYAIKSGINRANVDSTCIEDYVVICSSLAHYSIEHVCSFLGMIPENCLRVLSNPNGEINLDSLKSIIQKAISQGKKIAAIIAVGGATINLIPDPIKEIKQIIDDAVHAYSLEYVPYLHVDSVITWAWLSFIQDENYLKGLDLKYEVHKKIKNVCDKLKGINLADSFAADFHKTGFCPYAAGVFISKDSYGLSSLISNGYITPENPSFGECEPYRVTFENSRSALPIVSSWISIRKMGLKGLREYITYQLEVSCLFSKLIKLKYRHHFEILNIQSNGWELVLKLNFNQNFDWDRLQNSSKEDQKEYIEDCYGFANYLWYSPIDKQNFHNPVIGFVPRYSRKGSHEKSFPAFLIHPTSLHYDETTVNEMLQKIVEMKLSYEANQRLQKLAQHASRFQEITPPR